jgi:hypothetical protein
MGAMDAKRLELYETLATKDDVAALETRLGARMDAFESRMDARFARMEATLTRRMVTIMGAWTILFGSTIGWATALLR